MMIDIHADDYGQSPHTSAQILECCREGLLDSISIVPNFSCFAADMEKLKQAWQTLPKAPLLSVHLNFVEGHCLAEPELIPELVDKEGYFKTSWGSLFLHSYLPGRKKLQLQLETEIAAQIKKVQEATVELTGTGRTRAGAADDQAADPKAGLGNGAAPLRIDGHQHTQMIPVVFDALYTVLCREGYETAYIRDSYEPLWPYLKEPGLYPTYRPVNLIKNLILRFCSLHGRRKKQALHLQPMYLWGLLMSGRMDEERLRRLLPAMCRTARKKSRTLEILFHPGRLLEEEIGKEYSSKESLPFYLSADRDTERAALQHMKIGRQKLPEAERN